MRRFQNPNKPGFELLAGTERSQGAFMTLAPGEQTGGPDNEHPSSDQWLYVLSGEGHAIVDGERVALGEGVFVVIEAGEKHEIVNDGTRVLETISVYAPPAY